MFPYSEKVFQRFKGSDPYCGEFTTELVRAGMLAVPSGRIVACDPFVFYDMEPFQLEVKPGTYPVDLHLVHFSPDHTRVAFAILSFSESRPVRWTMAVWPGQDPSVLKENEIFGYGVDSGTGCFMDKAAAKLWETKMEYFDYLSDPWAEVSLDESGLNIILFHSGWGDGGYASYWGWDDQDRVVCLVTDFGVLDETDSE